MKFKIFWMWFFLALPACAGIQRYSEPSEEVGVDHVVRRGQRMLHLDQKEDLKNAFGKADLFGGKVDRGFVEVLFAGYDSGKNQLLFLIKEQLIKTNESTMARYAKDQITYSEKSTRNYAIRPGEVSSAGSRDGTVTLDRAPEILREKLPENSWLIRLTYPSVDSFNVDGRYYIKIVQISSDKEALKYIVMQGKVSEKL